MKKILRPESLLLLLPFLFKVWCIASYHSFAMDLHQHDHYYVPAQDNEFLSVFGFQYFLATSLVAWYIIILPAYFCHFFLRERHKWAKPIGVTHILLTIALSVLAMKNPLKVQDGVGFEGHIWTGADTVWVSLLLVVQLAFITYSIRNLAVKTRTH